MVANEMSMIVPCWQRCNNSHRQLHLLLAFFLATLVTNAHALDIRTESPGAMEGCSVDVPSSPPASLSAGDEFYGRLNANVRYFGDPLLSLVEGAYWYRLSMLEPGNPIHLQLARAHADLSVTGRQAYERVKGMGLSRAALIARLRGQVQNNLRIRRVATSATELEESVAFVVGRAYDVAWALRGPAEYREKNRGSLGWIAVAGEFDRPHRPVNALSADYPQRDIEISVAGQNITTRLVFIDDELDEPAATGFDHLPPDYPFPVVLGDLVIFLHGHGSTAEEAISVAEQLVEKARAAGRKLTVLSLDLPGYAYSSPVDVNSLPALPLDTNPPKFEGLDFLDASILSLVDLLEENQPGIRNQILGVMGGSLGGNLSLRLSRHYTNRYPWLANNVSWSPASVWPSFADSCEDRLRGYSGCEPPHSPISALTCFAGDTRCEREAAVWATRKSYLEHVDSSSASWEVRHKFFKGGGFIPQRYDHYSIAYKWYSDSWPCKAEAIEAGKRSLGEYYSQSYALWHWRIAHEQLIYTHQKELGSGPAFTAGVRSRLLALAGEDDNTNPDFLYSYFETLMAQMQRVDGTAWKLANTGHSIHAERPALLSEKVVEFLKPVPQSWAVPLMAAVLL